MAAVQLYSLCGADVVVLAWLESKCCALTRVGTKKDRFGPIL